MQAYEQCSLCLCDNTLQAVKLHSLKQEEFMLIFMNVTLVGLTFLTNKVWSGHILYSTFGAL